MLSDDELTARMSMNGKKANYLKLRRGLMLPEHMEKLQGESFRVFVYLCSMANQKKEPRQVAETGIKQLSRMLSVSVNTIRKAVATLEKHGYVERVEGGFFVSKLMNGYIQGGSDIDPLETLGGSDSDPGGDQILTPGGSDSDPGGIRNRPPGGSESDPLLTVNDRGQKRLRGGISKEEEKKVEEGGGGKPPDPEEITQDICLEANHWLGMKMRPSEPLKQVIANLLLGGSPRGGAMNGSGFGPEDILDAVRGYIVREKTDQYHEKRRREKSPLTLMWVFKSTDRLAEYGEFGREHFESWSQAEQERRDRRAQRDAR